MLLFKWSIQSHSTPVSSHFNSVFKKASIKTSNQLSKQRKHMEQGLFMLLLFVFLYIFPLTNKLCDHFVSIWKPEVSSLRNRLFVFLVPPYKTLLPPTGSCYKISSPAPLQSLTCPRIKKDIGHGAQCTAQHSAKQYTINPWKS